MRGRYLIIFFASTFLFTSCFDVIEHYQMNEDGSGVYSMELDMSRASSLMESFMKATAETESMDSVELKKDRKVTDSLILFQNSIDTATNLTSEEKKVLRNGYARMYVDDMKHQAKVRLSYPFKNAAELGVILQAIENQSYLIETDQETKRKLAEGNIGKLFKYSSASRYSVLFSANQIERKFIGTDSSWVVLDQSSETSEESEDANFSALFSEMGKISAKTVLELPRPIKNFLTNGNATLSADKKQITIIHTTINTTVLKPLAFTYKVDY